MSTLSLSKGSSLILLLRSLIPLSLTIPTPTRRAPANPIIPAHTGYPGVGDVPVFLSDQFASFLSFLFPLHIKFLSATLLFPLHTQKQGGVLPVENVGAPTFSIFPLIF